jgi:hypothetical protein
MSSAFSSGELRFPLPFTPALWHALSCEIDGFTGLAPLPPLSGYEPHLLVVVSVMLLLLYAHTYTSLLAVAVLLYAPPPTCDCDALCHITWCCCSLRLHTYPSSHPITPLAVALYTLELS